MTERALDAHGSSSAVRVQKSRYSNNGVRFQKGDRGRRIVHIDLPRLYRRDKIGGERIGVYFQAETERGLWAQTGADAAELRADDRLVQPQLIAPKGFIAERVV